MHAARSPARSARASPRTARPRSSHSRSGRAPAGWRTAASSPACRTLSSSPLLEIATGPLLGRAGVVGPAAAAAATALGAVRVGTDLEDSAVGGGTAAAAGLTIAGLAAVVRSTRGRPRAGLLGAIGAVVVFELVRRHRVLRAH
ncbi:hypothetical protein [Curtobacterium sp. MCPF17_052]|uniref:hypothetical protein n=1 Tax=Curtobacterium sp. MCPF17_052 TaxID=2175655 RepID=UPI0024E020B6|nr:hypothetical protein [Curtobacterium sp. MCPF17_052]WIB12688.1 hypothetical protein DEJ36_00710 [Curtobacterium sp. MCPF17_052]